jgi:hypothetical protein
MDPNLFAKHIHNLKKHKDAVSDVLSHIHTRTGVSLEKEECSISSKKVLLTTTSAKRSILIRKRIHEVLQEIGYTLTP